MNRNLNLSRIAVVFLLLFISTVATAQITYYSKTSGAANVLATWGTATDGTGTAPANFTTSGDIFILRSASNLSSSDNATWTIGSGVTLIVDGTLQMGRNHTFTLTINGTIEYTSTATSQFVLQTGGGNAAHSIVLASGATLITRNANGIHGVANASIEENQRITVDFPADANYQFTGGNQSTNGLPPTVNALTFGGSGTKTLVSALNTISSNLTLDGTVVLTLTGDLNIGGDLTLGAGTTFNASAVALSIQGNFSNSGTFNAGTSTVVFNSAASQQTITGETTFNNLTINSTGGVKANDDLTVNGVLNLESANPNETDGSLDMVVGYGDYSNILTPIDELTTTNTQSHDILNSKILYMGSTATTIGIGDVTGRVKRNTIAANVEYTFGSQYTTMSFSSAGTLPSAIMFVITKGSDRGIHANKTNTVSRLYQVIRTGGALPNTFSIKLRYFGSELNGNLANNLVLWDHHIPYNSTNTPHEHGKTAQNTTEGWVSLSGHGINYIASDEVVGGFTKYWMISTTLIDGNKWLGAVQNDWTNWNTASNWTKGNIPTAADTVIIPQTTYYPILPIDPPAVVYNLTIENGAILNGGENATLTIKGGITEVGGIGSWNNQGTFNASTTTVVFDFPRGEVMETATISGATDFYSVSTTAGTYLDIVSGAVVGIAGTITNNGTLDATSSTNTIIYNGTGDQTIINPNGGSTGYYNLTISTAGNLTWPEPNAMNIKGNLINNKSGLTIPGTITLNGTVNEQLLGGDYSMTFTNLTMNGTAGALLGQDQEVTGALILTSGLITTAANNLTASGTISGGSSSSYVNGKLTRPYDAIGSKSFPIGKGGNYRPLALDFASFSCTGTSMVSAEQFESSLPGTLSPATELFSDRHWQVTESGCLGTFSYTITLDGTGFNPTHTASVKMLKSDGAAVTTHAVTTPDYTNTTPFANFSYFGLGEDYLIWTGTTSSNWATASNWNLNIVPDASSNALIPEVTSSNFYPVVNELVTSPAVASNLLIQVDANLTIAPERALTVFNELTNESGNDGIIIESTEVGTGSLLHHTDNVPATINRYITGEPIGTVTATKYHTVSVPLTQSSNPLSVLFLDSYLYRFDPTLAEPWVALGAPTNAPLNVNEGYLIYYPESSITYSFAGLMNNGTFNALTEASGDEYFHLVPNPYPSAIDWNATSGWIKQNLYDAIWIWNSSNTPSPAYATFINGVGTNEGTDVVPAGQAFFVQASSTGQPTLSMNNDVRVHDAQPFFKDTKELTDILRLEAVSNGFGDEIVIRFVEGATMGFDGWTDASKLFGFAGTPQLYSVAEDNRNLAINSIPYTSEAVSVPVGFYLTQPGEVTLDATGLDSFDSDVTIFLFDHLTDKVTDLRLNPQYTFQHNPANDPVRFAIVFNSSVSVEEVDIQRVHLSAWFADRSLNLIVPEEVGENAIVNVFNTNGQLVAQSAVTAGQSSISVPHLSKGLYIIQLTGNRQTVTKKIIF